MRMRSGRAALVVALVLLGGCTGQSREHPTSATASANVVVPTEAPRGPTAGPSAAPAPIRAERWYPEGSRLLMVPAQDRRGSGTFPIAVPEEGYTIYLECRGGGEIRLWDMPAGADPTEPDTYPCDGAPLTAVTAGNQAQQRVIQLESTEPTVARWSLVAVAGTADVFPDDE